MGICRRAPFHAKNRTVHEGNGGNPAGKLAKEMAARIVLCHGLHDDISAVATRYAAGFSRCGRFFCA